MKLKGGIQPTVLLPRRSVGDGWVGTLLDKDLQAFAGRFETDFGWLPERAT